MTDRSRYHPRRWTLLTWIAVLMWGTYGILRNSPVSEVAGARLETRLMHPQFAEHIERLSATSHLPIGWPVFSIRPRHGFSPDLNFGAQIGPSGALANAGAQADFYFVAFVANGLIGLAIISSIVVVLQSRFARFSSRLLLSLTVVTAVMFALHRLAQVAEWKQASSMFAMVLYTFPMILLIPAIAVRLQSSLRIRIRRRRSAVRILVLFSNPFANPKTRARARTMTCTGGRLGAFARMDSSLSVPRDV